jgi:hypothetical protein
MTNQQIIQYIKLREAWKDTLRAKAGSFSSIINGLIRFSTFLAYWAIEKFLLDYDKLYAQNPNFKYVFYLSLAFGLWGLLDSAIGVFKYFQTSSRAEELKRQVEELEREL